MLKGRCDILVLIINFQKDVLAHHDVELLLILLSQRHLGLPELEIVWVDPCISNI